MIEYSQLNIEGIPHFLDYINPATKLVIPAAAERRAGNQKKPAIAGFLLPDQVRHRPRGNDGYQMVYLVARLILL